MIVGYARFIGYARVSTDDQTLDLQTDALKKAECWRIYTDQVSGAKTERPGLAKALDALREGDTLVVWRLDRLGRSLPHLIQVVEDLKRRNIGFKSLTESIDTTTPAGELIFHIFGALAQFERNLIRERTNAGLAAARARGRFGGGQRKLTPNQVEALTFSYNAKDAKGHPRYSIDDLCAMYKISRATLFRSVKGGTRFSRPLSQYNRLIPGGEVQSRPLSDYDKLLDIDTTTPRPLSAYDKLIPSIHETRDDQGHPADK